MTALSARTAVRLGAGAGFAGDRIDPAVDLAERGELDFLVFECLAERTIALAQQAKAEGRHPGFDGLLETRIRATAPAARANGTVIVTNAGAADPLAAAKAVRGVGKEMGLDLRVAAVTGDDVLDSLDPRSPLLGGEGTLWDYRDRIVSANAYLGAQGLVDALDAEPDVLLTGRTSDVALFLAPLLKRFGWRLDDPADLDRIAAGSLAGHLLECAGQLTGGYFADGAHKSVPGLARLGFPIADVHPDGAAELTKLPGTGGRLTRMTCLEQMLYEVDDPYRYLTPDVIVDLSAVTISEPAPGRLHVSGARGTPRPDTLKVSVGIRDGFAGQAEISYSGAHCLARATLAADIVAERWQDVHGLGGHPLRTDFIGVNSCRPWYTPPEPEPAEVRLRLSVRTPDRHPAEVLAREVEALYTNGPAGGGGVSTAVRTSLGIVSVLVPRETVTPVVTVLA